jgi:hypothetical protein
VNRLPVCLVSGNIGAYAEEKKIHMRLAVDGDIDCNRPAGKLGV